MLHLFNLKKNMSTFNSNHFEPSSAAAWKQKIQFDLKGADYNEKLLTKTNEGITIKPFYHSDDFEKINVPYSKNGLKICHKIVVSSEIETNLKAINVLNKDANALKFEAKTPFIIEDLFKNLLNKNIEFHFQLRFLSEEFTNKLAEFLKNETVFFNIDIIGNLAKTGNWYTSLNTDFKSIENLLQKNHAAAILSVNADLYQNSGANSIQQIAYSLAHANEYLTKFGSDIANSIQFNFSIGNNYFFEIAKLRAFRYLYNLILGEYNTTTDVNIYTEPSIRNKSIYSFKVNKLRATTANMSAILGGSNTVSNGSFDPLFYSENEFENNSDLNEFLTSNKDDFNANPQAITSDSYYIASLTKQMAEKALSIFKEIEKSGGFLKQLKEGTIQRKITEYAKKEQAQFDAGAFILVGANKHQNEIDNINHDLHLNAFTKRKSHKTLIIPIIPKRLSEKLEQKKLKNGA